MSTIAQKRHDLVPAGFCIVLDPGARELRRGLWFGGSPARVLRLSAAAADALDRLREHPARTPVERRLARRLTDVGLAHPVPPPDGALELTVVVPVRDRTAALARCLASLGARHPVVVVDDGSADPAAVRAVAREHGAHALRHLVNAGPAQARNTGLGAVTTSLVAFVDSDTEPDGAALEALAAHLADEAVAAAAPRIAPRAGDSAAGRYTRSRGTLDLGALPARVLPYTTVSYVPTAALVARTSALREVARDVAGVGHVFDTTMRVGEDVDLIWRLVAAGHRVRYDPSITVPHDEPRTWRGLTARRFRYGTSAAPLSERHPGHVAPLVVHPLFTGAVAAALLRRPLPAAALAVTAALRTRTALRRADVPAGGVPRATADALGQTFLGTARAATQLAAPLLLAALRPRATRAGAIAVLAVPPLVAWRRAGGRTTGLDPVRFAALALADDLAYGAGVITGCLRHRTTVPLRPRRARSTS
ncbi:mycofactocin biosynthesis glycosyltransferase MftF [Jatrophihabitans fulvus]